MISRIQQRRQEGFTIVELLIVIAVIAILALLVVTTYSGIQARSRDSQRQSDVAAIQTQLEAFYANESYYPTADDFNSPTWRTENNVKIDKEALRDPSSPDDENVDEDNNPLLGTGAATASSNQYGYEATGCVDGQCTGYTLSAWLEGDNAIYTKESLD